MWVHPPAFCASPLAADTHGFCQSILRSHREFTGFSKNGLDRRAALCYNIQAFKKRAIYRGVEQLEARRAHNPEVVGSSPASATKIIPDFDRKSGIFPTFLEQNQIVHFLILGQFWANGSKNQDSKTPFAEMRAVFFMPFSAAEHWQCIRRPWPYFLQ